MQSINKKLFMPPAALDELDKDSKNEHEKFDIMR
jgi:hypothetical protein